MMKELLLFLALLSPLVSAQTPQYKGVLLLYPVGAGPTDQPIKTTGFPKLYSDAAVCTSEVAAKAAELNVIYAQAEIAGGQNLGRWVSACVEVK